MPSLSCAQKSVVNNAISDVVFGVSRQCSGHASCPDAYPIILALQVLLWLARERFDLSDTPASAAHSDKQHYTFNSASSQPCLVVNSPSAEGWATSVEPHSGEHLHDLLIL